MTGVDNKRQQNTKVYKGFGALDPYAGITTTEGKHRVERLQ